MAENFRAPRLSSKYVVSYKIKKVYLKGKAKIRGKRSKNHDQNIRKERLDQNFVRRPLRGFFPHTHLNSSLMMELGKQCIFSWSYSSLPTCSPSPIPFSFFFLISEFVHVMATICWLSSSRQTLLWFIAVHIHHNNFFFQQRFISF